MVLSLRRGKCTSSPQGSKKKKKMGVWGRQSCSVTYKIQWQLTANKQINILTKIKRGQEKSKNSRAQAKDTFYLLRQISLGQYGLPYLTKTLYYSTPVLLPTICLISMSLKLLPAHPITFHGMFCLK